MLQVTGKYPGREPCNLNPETCNSLFYDYSNQCYEKIF